MSSEVQVTLVVVVAVLTLSSGFPQKNANVDKTSQESTGGLPFLEFKNGAVRLNFGGYHAEAGLGGLLGGGRAGGGLHVSAGSADGAHASAGLGGLLGDNGSAGGGLHARAGLGDSGLEAKAGLGGILDGSSKKYREGSKGVLFADSTWKKGEKNENDRKNIQVIPRASKIKEVASSSKDSPDDDSGASASSSAATVTSLQKEKENDDKDTGIGISVLKIKTLDKSEPVEGSTDDSNLETRNRGIYPARWYRKRLRAGARKNVLYNTVLLPEGDPIVAPSSPGIFARTGPEASYSHNDGQKASTLFDDIFNIPISTLNAVNQLLKNKIG